MQDDKAREHAITLFNKLHGVSYEQTPDFAKRHREDEIDEIIKALRTFAVSQRTPVIPDDMVVVPRIPTEKMGIAAFNTKACNFFSEYAAAIAAAPAVTLKSERQVRDEVLKDYEEVCGAFCMIMAAYECLCRYTKQTDLLSEDFSRSTYNQVKPIFAKIIGVPLKTQSSGG